MDTNIATWRILAVDDEPDNLNLLGDLLEFQGAEVRRAANGQEGLTELDTFKPTVILLDLSMPGMDGWELHRQLRLRTELAGVPIIAITALAMPTDKERVEQAGFDGYITKPFRIGTLLSELQGCIALFMTRRITSTSQPSVN